MSVNIYNRFINENTFSKSQEPNDNFLSDCKNFPVQKLEQAVEKIIPLIPDILKHVKIAKAKCFRKTHLQLDESAAIYLYTMPINLHYLMNNVLRRGGLYELKPWRGFLKLLMTALEKLPSIKGMFWRGIAGDAHSKFCSQDTCILWSVTSCSMDLKVLKAWLSGKSTLLGINAINGKYVSAYSAIPDEHEVILIPGTRVREILSPLETDALVIIHLEEIDSRDELQPEVNKLSRKFKNEYQRYDRIECFMNPSKTFPMETNYIKLSIVKGKEQHEKEKQLYDVDHCNIIGLPKIYDSEIAIDDKNIFDTCNKEEKQVLVWGRAGIGKSIFCRYLANQWAKGLYWSNYKMLALIPLCCLTADRYPPLDGQRYSLCDLIKQEVFQNGLSEEDEMLLKKQFDANKTLWILDGYDEIKQKGVPSHLKCLLNALLRTPHHIITSRPFLNNLPYEVQMEITGFSKENTEKYVRCFFKQLKHECNDARVKRQALLEFLNSNPSIFGIAQIPLNLELICSSWSNEDWSVLSKLTITSLYKTMIEWICRRYSTSSDKQIQQFSEDKVDECCQNELVFLETLAFKAMENGSIIIRSPLLKQASQEAKFSLQDCPNILNIGILKSLNKQGIGTQIEINKDHYFVHFSLQQYFAARYVVKALKESSTERYIELIECQNYNQCNALLFTFLLDLLIDSIAKQNNKLEKTSDLVSIRHLELAIICMEQADEKLILSRSTELSEYILNCIKCSFSIENETIRQGLLQLLRKLQSLGWEQTIINAFIDLLQSNDSLKKPEVLVFISELPIVNVSNELIISIATTLDDPDENVKMNACKILDKMGDLVATNEVIAMLISALKDDSIIVQEKACEILSKLGKETATDLVISNLLIAIELEDDEYKKANTCKIFGNIGERAATNEVIKLLLRLLIDKYELVRANAWEAFRKLSLIPVTDEVVSKLGNALDDDDKDVIINACGVLEKMSGNLVTDEIITNLVCLLRDDDPRYDDDLRWSAGKILVKIIETATTNEIINSLVGALKVEDRSVRVLFCAVLRNLGKDSVRVEVMNKLLSDLEDDGTFSKVVRDKYKQVKQGFYGAIRMFFREFASVNDILQKIRSEISNDIALTLAHLPQQPQKIPQIEQGVQPGQPGQAD